MISSGCTGWAANQAEYAVADSLMGPWEVKGNPCNGKDAETTFNSQSTFVLKVNDMKDTFIFMSDRWNPENLRDSRYVWLPLRINDGKMIIKWMDEWCLK
jgi:hypothetical protein